MGIRGLSKYLKNNVNTGVLKVTLAELSGKKIVIDTSIYMYRFNENNEMFENFYSMILMFKRYNITPLFIFDGIAPKEKNETIKKRQIERSEAEQKIGDISQGESLSSHTLHELKRKRTRVCNKERKLLKDLFDKCGVMYQYACGEADSVCANYVIKGEAWACLSDDMDLFVYGCPRVIRYFSLISKTAILYNLDEILTEMNMTFDMFQKICILSGTDYNKSHYEIDHLMALYKTQSIHKIDYDSSLLFKLRCLFTFNENDCYAPIQSSAYDKQELRSFLEANNFIFI